MKRLNYLCAELEYLTLLFKCAIGEMPLNEAYNLLGVDPNISTLELTKVQRQKALLNHPDVLQGLGRSREDIEEAANRMKQINHAVDSIKFHRERSARDYPGRSPAYPTRPEPPSPPPRRSYGASFEEATSAANVPVNANWMFVTKSADHWRTTCLVAIGKDDSNIYAVGIYNRRESPNIGNPEGYNIWKMNTETVPVEPKRTLVRRLNAAIKEAYSAVAAGDEFLKQKLSRISMIKTDRDWSPSIIYDSGRSISLKDALFQMGFGEGKKKSGKVHVRISSPKADWRGEIKGGKTKITINNRYEYTLSDESTKIFAGSGFSYKLDPDAYSSYDKTITAMRPKAKVLAFLRAIERVLERYNEDQELIAYIKEAISQRS